MPGLRRAICVASLRAMTRSAMAMARLSLACLLALTWTFAANADEPRLLRLGTGTLAGTYYPVGVALCRLINEDRRDRGVRCAAIPTDGSVENIDELRSGDIDIAMVQSDLQRAVLDGRPPFADAGPFEDLRALLSLHAEPLTIVTTRGSGISGLADLQGKRLSVGEFGSGQRATWDRLSDTFGWHADDFAELLELSPADEPEALCDGNIDAFVLTIGHPAPPVREAATACEAVLVPGADPEIASGIAASPVYLDATIPAGLYPGIEDATPTYAVTATLVARSDLPDELAELVLSAAFDSLDDLRGLHPVSYTHLTLPTMQ